MTRQRIAWILLALFVIAGMLLVLRPVPRPTEDNTVSVRGKVEYIFEGGEKDVVFSLQNDANIYYINRGLEQGLELASLRTLLLGEEVELVYIQHWTPLDMGNHSRHLARVRYKDTLIFSEM
ncbi:MAG: hypothetical protein D6730_04705 [Bacteroidetes bacterium]|nr:MAG: hypothetical protein D6730_04705 [Bacteroidota bacterium]